MSYERLCMILNPQIRSVPGCKLQNGILGILFNVKFPFQNQKNEIYLMANYSVVNILDVQL